MKKQFNLILKLLCIKLKKAEWVGATVFILAVVRGGRNIVGAGCADVRAEAKVQFVLEKRNKRFIFATAFADDMPQVMVP